tara:strand:+ start:419 stop:913 length:495 start_codon:yes stop_codon:yes gene_type:complete
MKLFKSLKKFIKANHLIAVLGLLVLLVAIGQFSTRKSNVTDNMHGGSKHNPLSPANIPQGAQEGEQYSPVQSNNVDNVSVPVDTVLPNELLPKSGTDTSLQGAGGDLQNVNLLKSGHHIGIDTVGGSRGNANLQLRADPPIQMQDTGPWMKSTHEQDTSGLRVQ